MPPVSSHHRLKNEVCYTFIPLVSSHDGLTNEIYYTHSLNLFLCTLRLIVKLALRGLSISGDLTLVSRDISFGRLNRLLVEVSTAYS